MPVNLDLFLFQLSDLGISRYWLSAGIGGLRDAGRLRGVLVASSGIPGPPEEEALEPKARGEARTERRIREMLLRVSYVFAWGCFEDLLQSCVREVLTLEPQRILDIGDWWRDGSLVRRQVVDHWTREQVVAELVRHAVEHFKRLPFADVPGYFARRLDVPWQSQWEETLKPIAHRRNQAAHSPVFESLTDDFVERELRQVLEYGEAIARACAQRHGIALESATIDEMRGGALTP